jgi:hypothetical protein
MSSGICGTSSASPADVISALSAPSLAPASESMVAAAAAREIRLVAAVASGDCLCPGDPGADTGTVLQGLRNRLVLKYLGVDYEYYNVADMQYGNAAEGAAATQ